MLTPIVVARELTSAPNDEEIAAIAAVLVDSECSFAAQTGAHADSFLVGAPPLSAWTMAGRLRAVRALTARSLT